MRHVCCVCSRTWRICSRVPSPARARALSLSLYVYLADLSAKGTKREVNDVPLSVGKEAQCLALFAAS
jgi:hypothetical protein